jgi:drug/metabolite transporter (DMT)-like permease
LIAAIWGLQGNYRLAGALLALAAAVSAAAYILAVVPWRSRNLFDTKKHRHAKASALRWFGRAGP